VKFHDSQQEVAVQGRLLAAISPVNTPHGYNLTFAFPMLLFIVIAGALYLRFRSPHKVPGHVSAAARHRAGTGTGAARAAAVPAGTVPAGTGAAEGSVAGTSERDVADVPDESEADGTETGA
jgi:hypothetical protein